MKLRILLCILFLLLSVSTVSPVLADEICFSSEQTKKLVYELD
jgi:hypothetical protein